MSIVHVELESAPDGCAGRRVLQHDGAVEADVGERPVHDHHVGVKDLPAKLQQAEHCTAVKLCTTTGKSETPPQNRFSVSALAPTHGRSKAPTNLCFMSPSADGSNICK